jgi:hypothetical protein
VIPNSSPTFINGSNPGEEYDPLKNQYITTRTVTVYGKATAQNFQGHKATVYAQEQLQVRDSPLFANAIFYNMNMELAPGPAMTVTGPVHSNQNIYVASSNGLNFDGPVTTSASLYHGVNWPNAGSGGDVSFENTSGTLVSMDQSGTWEDSTQSNFYQKATSLWGGNVQTSLFGVPTEEPVAVQNYVPATGSSTNDLNYGYQLIDPVVANTPANIASGIYNAPVEQQKFAYQAGLTLVVSNASSGGNSNVTSNTNTPKVTMETYARNSDGTLQYGTDGNPIVTTLNYTPGTSNIISTQPYATNTGSHGSTGTVKTGIYDYRQGTGYSLVQINMANLAAAIGNNSWTGTNSSGTAAAPPSTWWNGIVYIQNGSGINNGAANGIVTQHSGTGSDDVGIPASSVAVELTSGATIPNPNFASSTPGTTIATDAPLYIQGNYNSSGNGVITNMPPAAIAADSITVLSNNWLNSNSNQSLSSRNASTLTEINAAFLTGIVPSNFGGNDTYSGGVENFPRFLENWTNCTFSYQGSMVGLFQSEIATKPWPGTGGNFYNPPIRSWSFSSVFAGGTYPPGTPNSRTYKRINYTEMTAAQWNAAMSNLKADSNYW